MHKGTGAKKKKKKKKAGKKKKKKKKKLNEKSVAKSTVSPGGRGFRSKGRKHPHSQKTTFTRNHFHQKPLPVRFSGSTQSI